MSTAQARLPLWQRPRPAGRLVELFAASAFMLAAVRAAFASPKVAALLQVLNIIRASAPIVIVVEGFAGAMLTVAAQLSLSSLGGGAMAGLVVGFGGVREVFPLLAASAVAARSGAEFASGIATMKSAQQLEAVEAMGLDPMRLIVGPRIVGATFATPFCVLVGIGAGMLGSAAVGVLQLGMDRGSMWTSLWSGVTQGDIVVSALKGTFLGFLLGATAVREGLLADGGPAGIGTATNRAVVRALVVVCLFSLALTLLVYGPRAGVGR